MRGGDIPKAICSLTSLVASSTIEAMRVALRVTRGVFQPQYF